MGYASPCSEQSRGLSGVASKNESCPILPESLQTAMSCEKNYPKYMDEYWKLLHELMLKPDRNTYIKANKNKILGKIEKLLAKAEKFKPSCNEGQKIQLDETISNLNWLKNFANRRSGDEELLQFLQAAAKTFAMFGDAVGSTVGPVINEILKRLPIPRFSN